MTGLTFQLAAWPCRGCERELVTTPGVHYCATCVAAKCTYCHGRDGQHYDSCRRRQTVKRCIGCAGLGTASPNSRYCEACRARRCPECRRFANQHGPHCRYVRRQRRLPLTRIVNLVSLEELLALYLTHRAKAIGIARSIVGAAERRTSSPR